MRKLSAILICIAAVMSSCTKEYYNYEYSTSLPDETSLFVATDRHENGEGNNFRALLQIACNGSSLVTPSVVILGGDMVGQIPGVYPEYSFNDLKAEADAVYGDTKYKLMLVFGSHDNGITEGYGACYSGPMRQDRYYTYGISYLQMTYDNDSIAQAAIDSGRVEGVDTIRSMRGKYYDGIDTVDPYGISAESASQAFRNWAATLTDENPIVVVCHVPMHCHRNDNAGGLRWAKALNEVAEKHPVIFLWGHNHTLEESGGGMPPMMDPSEMGEMGEMVQTGGMSEESDVNERDYYLLTPGDTLKAQGDGQISESIPLKFYYGNAGYLKKGSFGYASVITFQDTDSDNVFDKMIWRRYGISTTETNFGDTAYPNPYETSFRKKK